MLIIQIALGIVLGAFLVRYAHQIIKLGVVGIIVTVGSIVAILAYLFLRDHLHETTFVLWSVIVFGSFALAIKYAVRGLGKLFLTFRPDLQRSPRWQKGLSLVGIDHTWIISARSDVAFIDEIGERLLTRAFGVIFYYCLSFGLCALLILIAMERFLDYLHPQPNRTLPFRVLSDTQSNIAMGVAAVVPLIALFIWIKSWGPKLK